MNECPDVNEIVSLGTLLEWDVERKLSHLMSCEACKTKMQELTTLYATMSEDVIPRGGFSEDVLEALPIRKPSDSSAVGPVISIANALLASMTAFFAIALVSNGALDTRTGVPVLVVAMTVGGGTFLRNKIKRPFAL